MKYDVTIVGAGPAGSTAAKFLSEQGIKTLLIDKDKFPRDKPCGGGLPYRVIKRYPYVEKENLVESYSYGGYASLGISTYKLKYEGDEPLVGMVLRKKFDSKLVELAIDAGSQFKQGKVIDIKITNDDAKIFLENGEQIISDVIIGADGANSIIAKKTGLRPKDFLMGVCILKEFKLDKKTLDDYFTEKRICHVHSRFGDISGYGWVFPKKEHLNIGIGQMVKAKKIEKKVNLNHLFEEYIEALKKENVIPNNIGVGKTVGGGLPIYPLEKPYSNRLILIGDAGGFISCTTGEGIFYAMASGEDAAKVITEAINNRKTDEESLSKFQEVCYNDFGKELAMLKKMIKRQSVGSVKKMFKKAYYDPKLTKLILEFSLGKSSIMENKNALVRRYLYSSFKSFFSFKK